MINDRENTKSKYDGINKKVNREDIKISWRSNSEELDYDYLENILDRDFFLDVRDNFIVEPLNLDNILSHHCGSEEEALEIYPKDILFDTEIGRSDWKTKRLLEYIEIGELVSPPIIDLSNSGIILFHDGNHRVALSRYLKLDKIPFLIRASNLIRIIEISDG